MAQLYPLQAVDARTMAARRSTLLFYEPGCGKTATSLAAANLAKPSDSDRWGIVAPRNAIKGEDTWEEALTVWTPSKKNVYVTHYEALDRPDVRAELKKSRFLIFDEIHNASNAYTKIFRNCYDVASSVHRSGGQEICATGTPIFSGIDELAAELVLAGILPLEQYNNFVWRYSKKSEGAFSYTELLHVPEIRQILSVYSIRRTAPEMGIKLPPLYPFKWPIFIRRDNPSDEYNRAAADFQGWYRETQGRALPPLARFTTLRRLLSMAKAPAVAAVSRNQILLGKNLLLFTEFRDTAEFLHKNIPGSRLMMGGETPAQRVQTFAAVRGGPRGGQCLVATGGALREAANVQALDTVGIVDQPWTPAELDQWFKRTWRNLQSRPVSLIFFLAQNDASENHVQGVLLKKTDMLIKLGLAPTGNLRQIGF